MPIVSPFKVFPCIVMARFISAAEARDLDGPWRLTISDTKRHVEAQATVRFMQEAAPSCMAGTWKRVVVDAKSGNPDLFPLSGPLAYRFDDGVLTLGRTSVCDAYLFLSGKFHGRAVRGKYRALGIGQSDLLGTFSMEPVK